MEKWIIAIVIVLAGCVPVSEQREKYKDRLTLVECPGFEPDTALGALDGRLSSQVQYNTTQGEARAVSKLACRFTVLK